jgi:hypothetical protein
MWLGNKEIATGNLLPGNNRNRGFDRIVLDISHLIMSEPRLLADIEVAIFLSPRAINGGKAWFGS